MKTATKIGKNPKPVDNVDRTFMIFNWLIGVCIIRNTQHIYCICTIFSIAGVGILLCGHHRSGVKQIYESLQQLQFLPLASLLFRFFSPSVWQIRDIMAAAEKSQTEYREQLDRTVQLMNRLNLPPKIQDRVRMWFTYNWSMQKTLGE